LVEESKTTNLEGFMNGKIWIMIGALLMGISVALSAYGAHGVPTYLSKTDFTDIDRRIELWKTAAQIQTTHSIGLILVGGLLAIYSLREQEKKSRNLGLLGLNFAGALMLVGMVLFSGLLYISSLSQIEFGFYVPTGGSCLILSWFGVAIAIGLLGK